MSILLGRPEEDVSYGSGQVCAGGKEGGIDPSCRIPTSIFDHDWTLSIAGLILIIAVGLAEERVLRDTYTLKLLGLTPSSPTRTSAARTETLVVCLPTFRDQEAG